MNFEKDLEGLEIRFSVNVVLLPGDRFFTAGAGCPQGHTGSVTHKTIFPSPVLADFGMYVGPLQTSKQDLKHCPAGRVLMLRGGELSLSWACNVFESKTFATDTSYLFLGEALGRDCTSVEYKKTPPLTSRVKTTVAQSF